MATNACSGRLVNGCHGNCCNCSNNNSSSSSSSNYPFPRPGGKVRINGQIKLTCTYVDHHGHTRNFDIETGKMYLIEAISSTKGLCTFSGKITDFDTVKGIENILTAPHTVSIGAIIVDYSTDYESKVIRIGVENITSIRPMESVEDVESTTPNTYFIDDPFAENQLSEAISTAEINADGTITPCCTTIDDPFANND